MTGVDSFLGDGARAAATPRRRRWTGVVLGVLVVVVTVLVAYEPPSSGRPFDPASRSADGLAVVVDVLDELGVVVEVVDELPAVAEVDAVLAPPVGWSAEELTSLAAAGVRVVAVVPPREDAELVETSIGGLGLVTRDVDCALLADVAALRSATWRAWSVPPDAPASDAERCIVGDGAAWATVVDVGAGTLVSMGTFAPLVNDRMRDEDAAVAAVRLLDVRPGDRVVALTAPAAADAGPTLLDVLDPRWIDAAWLTFLVLVLLAAARGRRLGRPVGEELPVRVPSGELARATGDLRHRIGAHAAALEELRVRSLQLVGARLGLGRRPTGEEAIAALRGSGIDLTGTAADALRQPPPPDLDAEALTRRAAALAELRSAVRRGPSPRPTGGDDPGRGPWPAAHPDHPDRPETP